MDYVYNIVSNVKYFYSSMNPAVLSGAIDVIVVEQPDGTYRSTPFHVRFGRYGVFNYDDKYVDVEINGVEIELKMKLGENGVAFFVEANPEGARVPRYMATSPLPEDMAEERRKASISVRRADDMPASQPGRVSGPIQRLVKRRHSTANEKTTKKRALKHKRIVMRRSGIYSGSYSDSECYRRLKSGSLSHHDTEWKWGEIPETKKEKEVKELKKLEQNGSQRNAYLWSWFGWPRRNTLDAKTSGRLAKQSTSDPAVVAEKPKAKPETTEKGLYLEDFENDPAKLAEYFGKRSGTASVSSNVDSGNGVSLGTSPCSPSALSLNEEPLAGGGHRDDENLTPTAGGTPVGPAPLTVLEATTQASGSVHIPDAPSSSTLRLSSPPPPSSRRGSRAQSATRQNSASNISKNSIGHLENSVPLIPEVGASALPLAVHVETTATVASPVASAEIKMTTTASIAQSSPTIVDGGKRRVSPPILFPDDAARAAESATAASARRKEKSVPPHLPSSSVSTSSAPSSVASGNGVDSPGKRRYNSGGISSASDFGLSDDEMASVEMISAEYKRSLRLSSDQLRLLNLHYGSNEAKFSITTKFQGTAWCSCHIYLVKWSEQLVISDIDGTITKSDVLGHVIPAIGGTWAHAGVAELYTRIKANGYRMIYLSSRAIGMSGQTKSYLKTVRQGTKSLPDGPVLLSPTSVLMALRKEVIERRPEEFKIACLTDLKNLFPDRQPFFAGFGNRITDVKSYCAVNIPLERILIINPSGVVTRADGSQFSSDYSEMANGSVDFIFPPLFRWARGQSVRTAITAAPPTAVAKDDEAAAKKADGGEVTTKQPPKTITKPEDVFLTSAVGVEQNAYYHHLTEEDSIAAYKKRSADLASRRRKKK